MTDRSYREILLSPAVLAQLTERTLEGEKVRAAWLDRGIVKRAEGIVRRNECGELVVSGDDGRETAVPRDAGVDRARRR